MAMMMARPTAASAAATTMTKKTKTWPETWFHRCEKATKVRLTALSINSIDMKMVMMFRLIRKLAAPTEKSTAARIRYQEMGTVMSVISPPFLGRNAENDADKGTDKSSEYGHEVIHLDVHYCS